MSAGHETDQPTIADRYRLRRRVGAGGSGDVWLADDIELDRRVAVKRVGVPLGLPDDERERARGRVLREARAAASIDHPHVVRVYDVLDQEDAVAIVMAYIDAPNLDEIVRDGGPLDDEDAATIGVQILGALEAAHSQGVVHRDIKPSNVLLSDDGAKLTDFGIATVADGTNLTRTGTALGSPGYIAPEQASGEDVTASADVWGVGATLYFAVEGRPPFDRGRAIATLHAVVHGQPDAATSDSRLLPIIDRLLEKDPTQRPGLDEARSWLHDFAAATVAMDPGATRTQQLPASSGERTASLSDTRREGDGGARTRVRDERDGGGTGKVVGTLISVVFLVVLAGLAWLWFGTTDGSEQAAEEQSTETTIPGAAGETEAPAAADDGANRSEPATETGQPEEARTAAGNIPDGWERFDGPAYSVAHPAGWEAQEGSGPRIDLTDPDTGTYLRVDYTDQPKSDPVADWEEQSDAFAQEHANYEEIRIEAVDYRDFDAAIWEYSYTADGQRFHAYNLGFTDGECGYALNLQAPDSAWPDIEPGFENFMSSFEPQGC